MHNVNESNSERISLEEKMTDQLDPKGSNGSSPDKNVDTDVRTFEFEGKEIGYKETDTDLEILIPEGLADEKQQNLAEELKKHLAASKKKNFDLNREKEELEAQKRKLAEEKQKLDLERNALSSNTDIAKDGDEMLKAFGVETWEDVEILRIEHPERYHKGLAKYNANNAAAEAVQRMAYEGTKAAIRNEGYNPETIVAFAKASGITNLTVAFDYYKRVNESPKGESLADIQKKSVKFIPSTGGVTTGKKNTDAPSLSQLYDGIR